MSLLFLAHIHCAYESDVVKTVSLLPPSWPRGGIFGASLYPVGGARYSDNSSRLADYMEHILDLAVLGRLNTVRITNFLAGLDPPFQDEVTLRNVDRVISAAARRNISVILDLSTFRNALVRTRSVMPYNSTLWVDFLSQIGRRYAKVPNLAFYSIAGEPACPNCRGNALRPTSTQLTDFYRETSAMLRHADNNPAHLISSGGLTQLDWAGGIDFRSIFALPHIDVVAIHAYDRDRNGSGTNGMLRLMPQIASYAHNLSKPFVLEEFGFDQSAFDQWEFDSLEAQAYERVYTAARAAGAQGFGLGLG